jgi:hypothetical protein
MLNESRLKPLQSNLKCKYPSYQSDYGSLRPEEFTVEISHGEENALVHLHNSFLRCKLLVIHSLMTGIHCHNGYT